MKKIYLGLQRFINDEDGVTSIEYSLIALLIALVIILAVAAIGNPVCESFRDMATMLGGTPAACPA